MPIFMDRHDVSDSVTAENVAELHQKDLKIQHEFGCRGLTYWFDDLRKTAFCLIEAPGEESIKEMHDHAHGEVPHRIIEVDPAIVESFLGRIEDPVNAKNTRLNIINDPAFRIIMAVEPEFYSFRLVHESCKIGVDETARRFEGRIVTHKEDRFLASFISVSKAIECALEIQDSCKEGKDKFPANLAIGLSAGVPVTQQNSLFEDTVNLAKNMCYINAGITITEEIRDLYRSGNLSYTALEDKVFVLSGADQKFLIQLMEFLGKESSNTAVTVKSFQQYLGLSKTQLYRKMTALTGDSPINFLLRYRLKQTLQMLHKSSNNIAETAYATGFNSPSYFSKCFRKVYGLSPTAYKELISKKAKNAI